jgi:2'-5' RNA ligase
VPRLFIALPPPPGLSDTARDTIDRLSASGADVRWEQADKLHCTLKFLGEVPAERIGALAGALDAAAAPCHPFSVVYRGIGAFPPDGEPRVLWIGMEDPSGEAAALARVVDECCVSLGFAREEHPFRAHVTIGRVRSPRRLRELHSRMETVTFEGPRAIVDRVHLVQSVLRPSGSEYTTLHASLLIGKP